MTWRTKLRFMILSNLGYGLVVIFSKLTKIKIEGKEYLEELQKQKARYILCPWHGRILLPIYIHRQQNIYALVSQHRDGELLARILTKLGYRTIRGSSTRGGQAAFFQMARVLKNGFTGAVVPDGPRGPRHKLKEGVLKLAQLTGAYILPITFSSSRKITFKSWDRFTLFFPFSKAIVKYGKPCFIPSSLSPVEFKKLTARLEQKMIALEQEADAYFRK
ncbi:MAG: DUF374 domain-containing protein [Calditrichaeota bacterium]|nr:MAG: DUF374 domain-containing protein [Calditrichota bacterium]